MTNASACCFFLAAVVTIAVVGWYLTAPMRKRNRR